MPRAKLYSPHVVLLLFVVGLSFIGAGFVMPLRSLYARDAGVDAAEIGLMTAAFLLASFLSTPPIGRLADRFGHGLVLWLGLLAHALVVIAYIPVQSAEGLILLRALEGITAGAVVPPARAILNGLVPAGRQGEAFGLMSGAQSAGILFGPAAGAILADRVGYEPSFLLAGAALALSAVAVWAGLPRAGRAGATPSAPAADPAASADTSPFRGPLLLPNGLRFVLRTPDGVFAAIWSLYMVDHGASLSLLGLTYTAFALPAVGLAPLAGRLSDRRGRFWPIVGGTLVAGGVYVAYVLPLAPYQIVALSMIEGVGASIASAALDGLLADLSPAGARGRVQANFSAAGTAGMLLGATAAGYLYSVSPGTPFLVVGCLILAATAALLLPGVARVFRRSTGPLANDG